MPKMFNTDQLNKKKNAVIHEPRYVLAWVAKFYEEESKANQKTFTSLQLH